VTFNDILKKEYQYGATISMVEEKQVSIPNSFLRNVSNLIMAIAILFLVVWTTVMFLKHGKLFDVGVYSVFIILFLFGLTGRLLYTDRIRKGGE
jgi:hypothetical protein